MSIFPTPVPCHITFPCAIWFSVGLYVTTKLLKIWSPAVVIFPESPSSCVLLVTTCSHACYYGVLRKKLSQIGWYYSLICFSNDFSPIYLSLMYKLIKKNLKRYFIKKNEGRKDGFLCLQRTWALFLAPLSDSLQSPV